MHYQLATRFGRNAHQISGREPLDNEALYRHVPSIFVSVRARGVIFGGDLGAAGGGACPTTSSFDLGGHRAHR